MSRLELEDSESLLLTKSARSLAKDCDENFFPRKADDGAERPSFIIRGCECSSDQRMLMICSSYIWQAVM